VKRYYLSREWMDLAAYLLGYASGAVLLPPVEVAGEWAQFELWEPNYEWSWY
jgi:hypothetical protein